MACIFCKIIDGEIPSDMVYNDEEIVAFRDINPQAPLHLLIIPRKHIPALSEITEADLPLVGRMVGVANRLAVQEGVSERGYRLVINTGKDSGQVVPHLHLHLLGGRLLGNNMC